MSKRFITTAEGNLINLDIVEWISNHKGEATAHLFNTADLDHTVVLAEPFEFYKDLAIEVDGT